MEMEWSQSVESVRGRTFGLRSGCHLLCLQRLRISWYAVSRARKLVKNSARPSMVLT